MSSRNGGPTRLHADVKRADVNHCVGLALRQATRRVTRLFDHHMAPTGLRVTQFSILSRLGAAGASAMNDLAAAMVMDRTTLTRSIGPLERDGLIAISVDPQDRRGRLVAITPAGRAKLDEAIAAWGRAQTAFEQAYGLDETIALHRMLRRVSACRFAMPDGL